MEGIVLRVNICENQYQCNDRIDELVYCKFDHLFNRGNLKVDFTKIKNRQLYTELKTIWDNSEFESSGLTTLGQLIGIIASDNLSKTYTDIGSWK